MRRRAKALSSFGVLLVFSAVMLSDAKHLRYYSPIGPVKDQRFFASLRMTFGRWGQPLAHRLPSAFCLKENSGQSSRHYMTVSFLIRLPSDFREGTSRTGTTTSDNGTSQAAGLLPFARGSQFGVEEFGGKRPQLTKFQFAMTNRRSGRYGNTSGVSPSRSFRCTLRQKSG